MQTEEKVGRQHQGMDRPGVCQVPEGSGQQGKMEETGCEIICGAPTTLAVTGQMMMMMVMMMNAYTRASCTHACKLCLVNNKGVQTELCLNLQGIVISMCTEEMFMQSTHIQNEKVLILLFALL